MNLSLQRIVRALLCALIGWLLFTPAGGAAADGSVLYLPVAYRGLDWRYAAPGKPLTPAPYVSAWIPPGFLEYDEAGFYVYRRAMHNRTVTVAFARDAPLSPANRDGVAAFALDTWAAWWDVFGGFPWATYTIVFRDPPVASPAGAMGIGWEVDPKRMVWPISREDEGLIAHETFHAWWGNAVEHASSHVDPATPEGWSLEGFTTYYGHRGSGPEVYARGMEAAWYSYQQMQGTAYDVPLVEAGSYALRSGDSNYWLWMYRKGALVAYVMDRTLAEQGLNLDHLLACMYEQFGLTGQRYVTEDVRAALEAVSGREWGDFFARYVYGTEALPLDGSFEYVEHRQPGP